MTSKILALETLHSSDLGIDLETRDIERLMTLGQLQELQPGTEILRQLSPAEAVYLPCSGMVMLERSAVNGRRQVIGFLQQGDYLGFTPTDIYPYSASALEEVILLKFHRRQFRQLCDELPKLKENVSNITNTVLGSLLDQLFAIGQKRAHERVGFLLHQLHQRQGGPMAGCTVHLPMKRSDIGDYLGLTLETTSRAFSRLRDKKIITTPDHHSVVILDSTALAALAEVD